MRRFGEGSRARMLIVVAFALAPLTFAPAFAASCAAPSFTLDSQEARIGERVSFSGAGFASCGTPTGCASRAERHPYAEIRMMFVQDDHQASMMVLAADDNFEISGDFLVPRHIRDRRVRPAPSMIALISPNGHVLEHPLLIVR